MNDEAEWLAQAAAEFEPSATTRAPGELRLYLRTNYEALMALKADRKLSWSQVASILSKRGLTKANGSPLDANIVAVTAAAVRLEKPGTRRKRRPVQRMAKALTPEPAPADPEPTPEPTEAPVAPAPEAANLRALLARRRPSLSEPAPVNLGPEDRRPRQETDENG